MYTKKVTIKNEEGLHARPASILIQQAKRFQSDIKLIKDEKSANAKSIIMVLSLGICRGDEICFTAEGEDEITAIDTLVKLIDDKFAV
jgi:phosphocarrier protein HPr